MVAAGRGGRDGRRSGAGKVDDGGDKREDGMQGSRSEAVDERGRSLVMDGGVRVSAPAWWRRTAADGVADGGGWGGEGVLAPAEYEWGNGGGEEGGTMSSGRACLKCEEIYKLRPRFKFPTSQQY